MSEKEMRASTGKRQVPIPAGRENLIDDAHEVAKFIHMEETLDIMYNVAALNDFRNSSTVMEHRVPTIGQGLARLLKGGKKESGMDVAVRVSNTLAWLEANSPMEVRGWIETAKKQIIEKQWNPAADTVREAACVSYEYDRNKEHTRELFRCASDLYLLGDNKKQAERMADTARGM
ncbi:MAG: hypothetical protein KGH66_03570 [Candidatus Micrarchaeota archaeon]|nr:hypothetical protein [Candidatus Micrarchaeota archaeon]